MSQSAIYAPAITAYVTEGRDLVGRLREAEQLGAKLEKYLADARTALDLRRLELGAHLTKVRATFPKRGTKEAGWGAYLEAIEVDEATAFRYMKLAEAVNFHGGPVKDKLPTYAELGLDRREGPQQPDAPPPTDDDIPTDEPAPTAPTAKPNRDAWCTPEWLTIALPEVDLDPCSNQRSTVRARQTYASERGEDGLTLPWFGLVYVNGPYSDLLPWAEKLDADRNRVKGAGFLVNADHSPAWWKVLAKHLHLRLDFDDRLEFTPPPDVAPSKNDRPQTLLMDAAFWRACNQDALLARGTLWALKNWHAR